MVEHCLASTTCLLSGLTYLDPQSSESIRSLRVLKGIHGFHIYAHENWVDNLLAVASLQGGFERSSRLSNALTSLSARLEGLSRSRGAPEAGPGSLQSNGRRLDPIRVYPGLYSTAVAAEADAQGNQKDRHTLRS